MLLSRTHSAPWAWGTLGVCTCPRLMAPPATRFGDLLPLPVPPEWRAHLEPKPHGRRGQQRVGRRRGIHSRAAGSVAAINHVAGFKDSASWPTVALNKAQRSALDRILRLHHERAPRPGHTTSSTLDAALRLLLRQGPGYLSGPGVLAPYQRSLVSLPRGQGRATPLRSLLKGEALRQYIHFETEAKLSDEELGALCENNDFPGLYFDPVLERSPEKYAEFVADLFLSGVIDFTLSPKANMGLFFVKKKNGKLRVIGDARRPNRLSDVPRQLSSAVWRPGAESR